MKSTESGSVPATVVDFVLAQEDLSLSQKTIELLLLKEYEDKGVDGSLSMTQERFTEMTGATPPTQRKVKDKLVSSGRWEIFRGMGPSSTTFKPVFLNEFQTTKKGN